MPELQRGLRGLACRPLEGVAPHIFTSREWALGCQPAVGEDVAWNEIAKAMSVERPDLIRVHQVHGATAAVRRRGDGAQDEVGSSDAMLPEADVLISDDPDLALAIQTADCVPLLMADPRTRVVLALHVGWRGMAARVVERSIGVVVREFGSRPADLEAAIGPSIGPCCYEVGDDVCARFEHAGFSHDDLATWFLTMPQSSPRNPPMRRPPAAPSVNRWYFDLWAATRNQLEAAGLRPDRVHAAELCTASHATFCSYRRDGVRAGRMAAAIKVTVR